MNDVKYDFVFDPNNRLEVFLSGHYFVGCYGDIPTKIMLNTNDILSENPNEENDFDYIFAFDKQGNKIEEVALVKPLVASRHHLHIKQLGLGDFEKFVWTFEY